MAATGFLPDPLPSPPEREASNTPFSKDSIPSPGLLLRELKHLDPDVADTADNDRQRKLAYLSQLPPDQIIELCLTFEQHVPEPIRRKIWPLDLEVAVSQLKQSPSRTQPKSPVPTDPAFSIVKPPSKALQKEALLQEVHPPGDSSSFEQPVQPLDVSFPTISSSEVPTTKAPLLAQESIITAAEKEATTPTPEALSQTEKHLPSSERKSIEPQVEITTASAAEQPALATTSPPKPSVSATTSATTAPPVALTSVPAAAPAKPSASTTPHPIPPPTPTSLTPYPYAPYGYPVQSGYPAPTGQAAYPHAPYYPPHGAAVPGYPYPGFSYPPPPGYPSHPPPPQAPPVSGEDLPSYEDMIVEALMDIGEPDGAAPKDLFLWMGARWPLQTNFRPSASQALQKAYRRGRLEKRSGGRYRLNPNWEGGATSKRTTRRPQTLAQTTYAMHHPNSQTPSSPFTHAPLPQRSHTSTPPAHPPQHQPYAGYTFPYGGYPGYPGYPPYGMHPAVKNPPLTSAKFTFGTKTMASKAVSSAKDKDINVDESGDAWEAAQHILKAINFGSLNDEPSTSASGSSGSRLRQATVSSSAPSPPIMASLGIDINANEDDGLGRATLTDEERASLQAQLALLAAQLSEIAAAEDDEDAEEDQDMHVSSPARQSSHVAQTITMPLADQHRPPAQRMIMDVNQFPDDGEGFTLIEPDELSAPKPSPPVSAPATEQAQVAPMASLQPPSAPEPEEESDEDEDMEMVDVDDYMRTEGIRT